MILKKAKKKLNRGLFSHELFWISKKKTARMKIMKSLIIKYKKNHYQKEAIN